MREKEKERAMREQMLREMKEREEVEERQRIKKEAIFKANPIRQYKPITSIVSEKALTIPVEPNLHTQKRAQLKEPAMNID